MNVRIKDPAVSGPPPDNWSRKVSLATVLPHARRFCVPGMAVEGLVRAAPDIFEYPTTDRVPLPRWTFRPVTLLGEAAHSMDPVGSNEAGEAIPDALRSHEKQLLPPAADLVRSNRRGGSEHVIDKVGKPAIDGFSDLDGVLGPEAHREIVTGYASATGVALRAASNRPHAGSGPP